MATNDLISLRLSVHAEEPQQVGILKAWDRTVTASQIMKMSILGVTTAVIVFAVLSVENPIVLANATASLVGTSAPQDGTRSTANAPALLPTASEAPTGDEIAAAFKTPDQSQTEISQPPAEALLKQFRLGRPRKMQGQRSDPRKMLASMCGPSIMFEQRSGACIMHGYTSGL